MSAAIYKEVGMVPDFEQQKKHKMMTTNDNFEMSFFRAPISNKMPAGRVTPFWVYQYLRSHEARPETCKLRAIAKVLWQQQDAETQQTVKDQQRASKGQHLEYVTPSGVFGYCNDNSLISHSRLLCIDLDDVCPIWEVNPVFYDLTSECYHADTKETDAVELLKWRLVDDTHFNTVLAFRSPRGNGLKWWIEIDLTKCDHRTWFQAVRNYLMATYGLDKYQVDPHVGNLSRACWLCHDPLVYLRTDLIENFCI